MNTARPAALLRPASSASREPVADLTRRGFLTGTAGAAALLGLSACGSSDAGGSGGDTVRIPGKLGTAELKGTPARVVTLGIGPDVDSCLALGVVPVAIARDSNVASGIEPWTAAALGDRKPTLLDTTDGLPLESIAKARPDVIVATSDYNVAKVYDKLRVIAPVLSYTTGPNTDRWEDTVARLGKAFDRSKKAAAVVAGVNDQIAKLNREHPELSGKTFTFGPVQPDGAVYTVSSETDLSAALLARLGMKLSPKVTSLKPSTTPGKSVVSAERLDLLDADVLILTYVDTKQRALLEAQPSFRRLDAVRRGAYVALPFPVAIAAAFPDPLSVPYAVERIVPKLAAAVQ